MVWWGDLKQGLKYGSPVVGSEARDKGAWEGKQLHELEMTALKLGSQILDFPFPVHFSEDLILLWASV